MALSDGVKVKNEMMKKSIKISPHVFTYMSLKFTFFKNTMTLTKSV